MRIDTKAMGCCFGCVHTLCAVTVNKVTLCTVDCGTAFFRTTKRYATEYRCRKCGRSRFRLYDECKMNRETLAEVLLLLSRDNAQDTARHDVAYKPQYDNPLHEDVGLYEEVGPLIVE